MWLSPSVPCGVKCLLYERTALYFPLYLLKTIPSYLRGQTFEASFRTATSTFRRTRTGVAQGEKISPVLFSLYVDMPSSTRRDALDLYADDAAVIDTSRQPALLFRYL
jgi:hypothetical protein